MRSATFRSPREFTPSNESYAKIGPAARNPTRRRPAAELPFVDSIPTIHPAIHQGSGDGSWHTGVHEGAAVHHVYEELLEEQKRKVLKAMEDLRGLRAGVPASEQARIDAILNQLEQAVEIDKTVQRGSRRP
jgi:hypothetical protein